MHLNMPYWKLVLQKLVRSSMLYGAYAIILIAIISSIFRALTPMAARYQPQFEQTLMQLFGCSVHIRSLETGWYWFQPVVKANTIVVKLSEKHHIKIKQVQLGIDVLSSLVHWRIQPGLLLLDGVKLHLQATDAGWFIQGEPIPEKKHTVADDSMQQLLAILLAHRTIQIKHVQVDLDLQSCALLRQQAQGHCAHSLKLRELNATLIYRFGKHRLRGEMLLSGKTNTPLSFGAEVILDPMHPERLLGQVYLGVSALNIKPWLKYFPSLSGFMKTGTLSTQLWGNVEHAQFTSFQMRLDAADVSWNKHVWLDAGVMKRLNGHISWKKTNQGMKIVGNDVVLSFQKHQWPRTAFAFEMNQDMQAWDLYVQRLDLKAVLKQLLPVSKTIELIKHSQMMGELTELHLKKQRDNYFLLGRFTDLSWLPTEKWPGVTNMSGVLNWEPSRGHVGLESQALTLLLPGKQPLPLSVVNMDLLWEQKQDDWFVSLKQLAVDSPHLKLNATGTLDHVSKSNPGSINLVADFALKQGEYWMQFLPQSMLKPKLYAWLVRDIHALPSGVGKMRVKGELTHFPFDDGSGQFQIETLLEGAEIRYAKQWPVATDIQAILKVERRRLTAHIAQANLGGAKVSPLDLMVNDLGLNQERLMLHGLATAPAPTAWSIVLASPLGQKNLFLKDLDWMGPVSLDLQFDVPLFPGDDEILLQGTVYLADNQCVIKQPAFMVSMAKLTGKLNFDQAGLLPSQLEAQMWQHPVSLHILNENQVKRETVLTLKTPITAKALFETFYQPVPKWIHGETTVTGALKLSADENILTFTSPLTGIGIQLPPWMQKKKMASIPFQFKLNFSDKHPVELVMQYDKALTVTRTAPMPWAIHIALPNVIADVLWDHNKALLSGDVQVLKLPTSWTAGSAWSQSTWSPADFPDLDLTIHHLQVGTVELGHLSMKSKIVGEMWQLSPWILQSPHYMAKGTATWQQSRFKSASALEFDFETGNLTQTLQQWQLSPFIEKGKGQFHVKLTWPDVLWRGKLNTMQGEIKARITSGRTMNFSKQTESRLGMAKVLSLFSLQTIPRRLKLDFSDLSHEGYSFDVFEGVFQFVKGVLKAESCTVDGPAAGAEVKGQIDVARQLYDLSIRVFPHLTSSLPIVATIAGGPIAGVATLAASSIINQGMQKMTTYTYRVTGPWKDPVIETVGKKSS